MTDRSISERMFDGFSAESELGDNLTIEYERIGFDHYDNSLELYGVHPAARLTDEEQKSIHAAGFSKVYVNHTDKWETHYSFHGKEFKAAKGWRVSYPHKRGVGEKGILVEEIIPSWPQAWFESGYCRVIDPAAASHPLAAGETSGQVADRTGDETDSVVM